MREKRPEGISNFALLVVVLMCAGVLYLTFLIGCYLLTDRAYEVMIAGPHSNRAEVEAALARFKKKIITDKTKMGGQLSAVVQPNMEYTRYTRYGGLGIDIVYDEQGRVIAIWPKYE
jgi:hypothetical protein